MSKRVADWTSRLEPLLRQQEESVPFDIRDYSHRLIDIVDTVTHVPVEERHALHKSDEGNQNQEIVEFDDVAYGHDRTDVCRMFLACLQLANTGNILICPPSVTSSQSQELSHFSVRILQHNIRVEGDIELYRAPSLTNISSQQDENDQVLSQPTTGSSKRSKGKKQPLKQSASGNSNARPEQDDIETAEDVDLVTKAQPMKRNLSQRSSSRVSKSTV